MDEKLVKWFRIQAKDLKEKASQCTEDDLAAMLHIIYFAGVLDNSVYTEEHKQIMYDLLKQLQSPTESRLH